MISYTYICGEIYTQIYTVHTATFPYINKIPHDLHTPVARSHKPWPPRPRPEQHLHQHRKE